MIVSTMPYIESVLVINQITRNKMYKGDKTYLEFREVKVWLQVKNI